MSPKIEVTWSIGWLHWRPLRRLASSPFAFNAMSFLSETVFFRDNPADNPSEHTAADGQQFVE
jgi:hypothetical protein